MEIQTILVTGAAGFIGAALSRKLVEQGLVVIGIDNINDYYDPNLKRDRISDLQSASNFTFLEGNIADKNTVDQLFTEYQIDAVVNMAAQAGVRYSLTHPHAYIESNVVGFMNLLEACRHQHIKHFVYASSSSVYGANIKKPFSVSDNVDHPVSLYAATKKSNELMAHTYSHLYDLPTTGLRFFTVYGPWGRPDMAPMLFSDAIMKGEPIKVFNNGDMARDFTYIDDIIDGVIKVIFSIPQKNNDWDRSNPDPATSYCPYKIYNIGNNRMEKLMRFIEILEDCLGKKAIKEFLPMQPGDVQMTYADIDGLISDFNYTPDTSLEVGVSKFVQWYKSYYKS